MASRGGEVDLLFIRFERRSLDECFEFVQAEGLFGYNGFQMRFCLIKLAWTCRMKLQWSIVTVSKLLTEFSEVYLLYMVVQGPIFPFGGKVVVLGGYFRQVFPVVQGGVD